MDRAAFLTWLASLPPAARDGAVDAWLGLGTADSTMPGPHLIGYQPSGVDSVVRAAAEVPITPSDVVIDLGSGLGKVVFLMKLLSGATVRGVELQPELVARAREAATRLHLDVAFEVGDVRDADLDDGTVFYAYLPFTGPALATVLARLHAIAARRPIVVVALGLELERIAPWLVDRRVESFWLSIYDSAVAGVPRRT